MIWCASFGNNIVSEETSVFSTHDTNIMESGGLQSQHTGNSDSASHPYTLSGEDLSASQNINLAQNQDSLQFLQVRVDG